MKKIVIMAAMVASAASAFAQDALVKEAAKLCGKGEYKQAVETITPALTSDATTDKAAAWNTLSDIHYQWYSALEKTRTENQVKKVEPLLSDADQAQLDNSIVAAIEAAEKCDEFDCQPDAKGKVKPRFRKQSQDRYVNGRLQLVMVGDRANKAKDMKLAQKAWSMYVDTKDAPMFTGAQIAEDPYHFQIAYYAGLIAYQNKDYANALKYAKEAAKDSSKVADANEVILFATKDNCKTKEDSVVYVNTLKEFHKQNPREARYFNLLGAYYSEPGRAAEKKAWAEEECNIDPQNKMAWAYKGESDMNANQWDAAIESYKKAIEIDPDFVQVVFNLGACYNSKAIELKDKLADKKTGGLTPANATKVKAVLADAKTYMEKAQQLDPNREKVNWAYPLYQIYYGLGDKAKTAEMEKILGN